MSQREFDQYSASYADLLKDPIRDRFAGSHPEFFQVRKADLILDYFRRKQLDTSKMRYLDVGCGQGDLLRILRPSFGYAAGCDPSAGMIESLQDMDVRLQVDESRLPFPDEYFDFVTASGVFHHVPPENRINLAKEVNRVLKPKGVFAIIEHNPLNPVTRVIVSRSPVDEGAVLLRASETRRLFSSANLSVDVQCYFLYLPTQLYKKGGLLLEKLLIKVPAGGQYAVFGVKTGYEELKEDKMVREVSREGQRDHSPIENAYCPICHSSSKFMAHHPETDLYRCTRCGHAYSHLDSMQEFEHYGDDYYDVDHKQWFDHPNIGLFARVAETIPRGASLLDVGCGRGDFLRYLRHHRQDLRLSGIDLNANQTEKGIRLIQGDITQTEIQERFDAVVSLAVIEHISDVTGFLRRVYALIKPGGMAVIMTLNDDSLLYALARLGNRIGVPLAFNRLYSRHHLHHFTRESFRTAVRMGGFSIESDFVHAAPLQAIDIPAQNRALNSVLRCGVWIVFRVGAVTGRNYLQTIVARSESTLPSTTGPRAPL